MNYAQSLNHSFERERERWKMCFPKLLTPVPFRNFWIVYLTHAFFICQGLFSGQFEPFRKVRKPLPETVWVTITKAMSRLKTEINSIRVAWSKAACSLLWQPAGQKCWISSVCKMSPLKNSRASLMSSFLTDASSADTSPVHRPESNLKRSSRNLSDVPTQSGGSRSRMHLNFFCKIIFIASFTAALALACWCKRVIENNDVAIDWCSRWSAIIRAHWCSKHDVKHAVTVIPYCLPRRRAKENICEMHFTLLVAESATAMKLTAPKRLEILEIHVANDVPNRCLSRQSMMDVPTCAADVLVNCLGGSTSSSLHCRPLLYWMQTHPLITNECANSLFPFALSLASGTVSCLNWHSLLFFCHSKQRRNLLLPHQCQFLSWRCLKTMFPRASHTNSIN